MSGRSFMFSRIFGPRRAEPMLVDLIPIVEGWRSQVLVCDQAELAGPIAARLAGVPNVTHSFGRLLPAARVARAEETMANLWRAHGLSRVRTPEPTTTSSSTSTRRACRATRRSTSARS